MSGMQRMALMAIDGGTVATVIGVIVILGILAAIIAAKVINKKKGKSSCSCGGHCGACGMCCSEAPPADEPKADQDSGADPAPTDPEHHT